MIIRYTDIINEYQLIRRADDPVTYYHHSSNDCNWDGAILISHSVAIMAAADMYVNNNSRQNIKYYLDMLDSDKLQTFNNNLTKDYAFCPKKLTYWIKSWSYLQLDKLRDSKQWIALWDNIKSYVSVKESPILLIVNDIFDDCFWSEVSTRNRYGKFVRYWWRYDFATNTILICMLDPDKTMFNELYDMTDRGFEQLIVSGTLQTSQLMRIMWTVERFSLVQTSNKLSLAHSTIVRQWFLDCIDSKYEWVNYIEDETNTKLRQVLNTVSYTKRVALADRFIKYVNKYFKKSNLN